MADVGAAPPPLDDGRPREGIDELIELITTVTRLMKDQANDLLRSKRFQRFATKYRPSPRPTNPPQLVSAKPPLLYSLEPEQFVPLIDALEEQLRFQLTSAYASNPGLFQNLGLTVGSDAWRLKYAAFQTATVYADSPSSFLKRGESRVVENIEKRDAAFEIGDTAIGTAMEAIPFVGSALSHSYEEVKENLKALGGVVAKIGGGIATALDAVKSAPRKVWEKLPGTKKRKSLPNEEPIPAGGESLSAGG
jgi:hypothetical protein